MARLSLALLGTLHVALDGQPVTGFVTDKVRALLVYLVMEADRAHRRDTLAELLWPEQPAQVARNSLRQALATLRQAIGDRAAVPPFLLITAETLQFNVDSDHWLDVAEFTALLDACRQHPHVRPERCTVCAQRLEQVITLYRRSFLEQFFVRDSVAFEEWMLLQRERLHRAAFTAVARLTTYYEQRGAYPQAERYAWRQLDLDPWREEAHRQLMRVLALSGQRSAALQHYDACRRLLQDELGVLPTPETDALYDAIRTGALARPSTPHGFTSALPVPLTSFIGRERASVELAELLTNRAVRLVTLVGAPGIGKTRLALRVATELQDDFAAGVWVVDLAPLSDWELVLPTIAQLLGVGETRGQPLLATLQNALRERHMLVVLDNVEQVLPAGVHLAALLAACPHLTILVTSRAPLHISGEHTVAVPPLTLPAAAAVSLATLTQSEAGALFVARATAVQGTGGITDATAPAIAAICSRLEGVPLAIELAAARARLFTPPALLARLTSRLALLTGGAADRPARQQTMRATIDWSYGLLTSPQQRLFVRLAVFVGGWTVDAATAVCDTTGDLGTAVLDGLQALVDANLLRLHADADGEPRFHRFATIREYALERLAASAEAAAVHAVHARYFLALAEQAEPQLRGPQQTTWLRRLDAEHDNLRAALAWEQTADADGGASLRLVAAVWRFWFLRGHVYEWERWLAPASDRERTAPSSPSAHAAARAKMLAGLAVCVLYQGAWDRASQLGNESVLLARRVGDRWTEVVALVAARNPFALRAAEPLDEAVVLARDVGDPWLIAWTLSWRWYLGAGDVQHKRAELEQSVTLARAVGDPWLIGWTLVALGRVLTDVPADRAAGIACLRESLAIWRERGDTLGTAWCLGNLASAVWVQGDLAEAARLHEERLAVERALGNDTGVASTLLDLGEVEVAQGAYVAAHGHFEASLAISRTQADRNQISAALHHLGLLALAQGDTAQARAHYEVFVSTVRDGGDPPLLVWAQIMLARTALAEGAYARAEAYYRACLASCTGDAERRMRGHVLVGLGAVANQRGEPARAARLMGAAWADRARHGLGWSEFVDRVDYEERVARVRMQLDAATFDAAWAAGQAMAPDEAIAYALNAPGDVTV